MIVIYFKLHWKEHFYCWKYLKDINYSLGELEISCLFFDKFTKNSWITAPLCIISANNFNWAVFIAYYLTGGVYLIAEIVFFPTFFLKTAGLLHLCVVCQPTILIELYSLLIFNWRGLFYSWNSYNHKKR